MKKICLNMIVKNESKVIRRSLGSVKKIIDYWVIVDTGSTDGTQQMIKEYMKDIPGELHERPWVNFEHNRNEALDLAKGKGDYLLFIDADEEFTFARDFALPILDQDHYIVKHRFSDLDFYRISLIKNDPKWRWKGVIHESIIHPQSEKLSSTSLNGVVNLYHNKGGHRAEDPNKCHKDAEVLKAALEKEPDNARYMFYLAQSYFEGGEYQLSLPIYEKRATMGGCEQETFWSLFRIAILQEYQLNFPPEVFIKSYCRAYQFRPSRIEPLYYLACYFSKAGKHLWNYYLLKIALALPRTSDWVFVERWMIDWALQYQLTGSCFMIGRYQEAWELGQQLLANKTLPQKEREALQLDIPTLRSKASK